MKIMLLNVNKFKTNYKTIKKTKLKTTKNWLNICLTKIKININIIITEFKIKVIKTFEINRLFMFIFMISLCL